MSYTNLPSNENKQQIMRARLKSSMDDFSSFSLNDNDMFEKFGAFIISEKRGDLKFYNNSSYSNEYTKPQFNNTSILTGINFDLQKISFKIGVYAFSIEEYKELLNLLNPYKVFNLSFDFAPDWFYLVKLSGIQDSPRYILDSKGNDIDNNKEYLYYTELQLNFEIQGTPCVYAKNEMSWKSTNINNNQGKILDNSESTELTSDWKKYLISLPNSDLDIPFSLVLKTLPSIDFFPKGNIQMAFEYSSEKEIEKITATEPDFGNGAQELFSFQISENFNYPIEYNSEFGLLFKIIGDKKYLLNELVPNQENRDIFIQKLQRNLILGKFSLKDAFLSNCQSIILWIKYLDNSQTSKEATIEVSLNTRARTNII